MKFVHLGAIFLLYAMTGGELRAQGTLYNTLSDPSTTSTDYHYLQLVDLADIPGTYTITQFQLEVTAGTNTPEQVILNLYTGIDASSNSTSALANATDLGGGGQEVLATTFGAQMVTITPSQPITFTLGQGANLGVEVYVLDNLDRPTLYGQGVFTDQNPTVGSSPGYVWIDTSGALRPFTGAEQTRLNMSQANMMLSITGIAPAPEPSTWALMLSSAILTGVAVRARGHCPASFI